MHRITLGAASRNRPDRMSSVIRNWILNSDHRERIEIIISIDEDDLMKESYISMVEKAKEDLEISIKLLINKNTNTVEAINRIKGEYTGDLIFIFSDDTGCFNSWDTSIDAVYSKMPGSYIIKTNDGVSKDLITMPIFTKSYLDHKPWIYYPGYKHMFCDTELTCITYMEDKVIDASDLEFTHFHYTQGHSEKDEVDIKNQNTFYDGFRTFTKRMAKNFHLSSEIAKGKIPPSIMEWIDENIGSLPEEEEGEEELFME
jgi:hypothetical protein